MGERAGARLQSPPLSSAPPLIMRKCACGSGKAAGLDNSCQKCRGKRVQRKPSAVTSVSGFDVARMMMSAPSDRAEHEADRMADHASRALAGHQTGAPPGLTAVDTRRSAAAERETGGYIVDDDVDVLASGQMRKREFLDELRRASCATADRVLAHIGRSTDGCPYIVKWIGYYEQREAAHVERALHKFAPETMYAASARAYVPLVAERIGRGVQRWAITGQLPDLPPELMGAMAGGSGIVGLVSRVGAMFGQFASAIGGLFRKSEPGADVGAADPGAVAERLGEGTPLEPGVRGRMEDVFGHSFSDVRVHADTSAGSLSRDLGARAFTIGAHVAFASGEYKPGTPAGDALLAHELAHVVQQSGGSQQTAVDAGPAHEDDADVAAVAAVAQIHAGGKRRRFGGLMRKASVSLQRCGGEPKLPDAAAKDKFKGTHLPNTTEQKEMLADLGIRQAEPPKSAAQAAAEEAAPAPDQPKLSESAKVAERQWDGIEQPGISKEDAEKNRAALAADIREVVDSVIAGEKIEKPKHLAELTEFEGACQAAKEEVDRYFGDLVPADRKTLTFKATGPDANILSSYNLAAREAKNLATPTASGRIMKIIDSSDIGLAAVAKHFFQRKRSPEEKAFFAKVVADLVADPERADKLVAYSKYKPIARPFPDHRGVFLPNDDASRAAKWQAFGTCAHEYIHTLMHPAFEAATKRASSDVKSEGFTHMFTRELMTAVLDRVTSDSDMRKRIQGDAWPADTSTLQQLLSDVYTDATKKAEHIRATAGSPTPSGGSCSSAPSYQSGGFNAVKAAYFLGHVELIGLAPDGKPGPVTTNPDEVPVPDGVDDVEQLSRASGVPVEEILAKNPTLKNEPTLTAGQLVVLPGCRMHVVINESAIQSTFVPETKSTIAARNNVSTDDLDRANPGLVGKWDALTPGQRILIPRH